MTRAAVRRARGALASLVAAAAVACGGDGVIDLLPERPPPAPGPVRTHPVRRPPMPRPSMPGAPMPAKPMPPASPPCDSGRCPPMMPGCEAEGGVGPVVGPVDAEVVTP